MRLELMRKHRNQNENEVETKIQMLYSELSIDSFYHSR